MAPFLPWRDCLADSLPDSEAVQPLFVTVDPERDTAERLAIYLPSIHPRLVGFTGAGEEIRQVALTYKAYFAKVERATSDDYVVDHTSFIYLTGRTGEYLGFLSSGTDAERLTQVLKRLSAPSR